MTDHITLLHGILQGELDLDYTQDWINEAREAARTNQVVQLALDRRQAEVDCVREQLEFHKFEIPRNN